jgi:hypothetical protein
MPQVSRKQPFGEENYIRERGIPSRVRSTSTNHPFATNALCSNSCQGCPEGTPNQLAAVLVLPSHALPYPLCRIRCAIEGPTCVIQTSGESPYDSSGGYSNRVAQGKRGLERGNEGCNFQADRRKPALAQKSLEWSVPLCVVLEFA